MNPDEYVKLSEIEKNHWFYKGKRAIVWGWICRLIPLTPNDLLLDAGACTGLFLDEIKNYCKTIGLEFSPEGRTIAANLNRKNYMVGGSLTQLPFRDNYFKVAVTMDVLEHIADHQKALDELIRVTRPNGIIAITVPACSKAMSDWDIALGHYRRYETEDFKKLIHNRPVQILRNVYTNNVIFFPVILYRRWLMKNKNKNNTRLEDTIPAPWLNHLLYILFVKPAMISWLKIPFGLSILLILRKNP